MHNLLRLWQFLTLLILHWISNFASFDFWLWRSSFWLLVQLTSYLPRQLQIHSHVHCCVATTKWLRASLSSLYKLKTTNIRKKKQLCWMFTLIADSLRPSRSWHDVSWATWPAEATALLHKPPEMLSVWWAGQSPAFIQWATCVGCTRHCVYVVLLKRLKAQMNTLFCILHQYQCTNSCFTTHYYIF